MQVGEGSLFAGVMLVVGKKSGSRGQRQSIARVSLGTSPSREFAKSIQTQLVHDRVC